MLKYTLAICFLISLCSCKSFGGKNKAVKIEGSWRLSGVVTTGDKILDNEDRLMAEAKKRASTAEGEILSFFSDNKYTIISSTGKYITGKWRLSRGRDFVTLEPYKAPASNVPIHLRNINDKDLLEIVDRGEGKTNVLLKQSSLLPVLTEDPYYMNNNDWRIPAAGKESDAQIKYRLQNLVQHYIYLLKAARIRKDAVVHFTFSKSCIKIYNGGIGATAFGELDSSWIKTFYNENDATKAYDFFEGYLGKTKFKGASTGNWIDDDKNILLSIYAIMKKDM